MALTITQDDANLIASTIWAKAVTVGSGTNSFGGCIGTLMVRTDALQNTRVPALQAGIIDIQQTLALTDGADVEYIKDKLDDLTSDPVNGTNPTVDAVRYGVANP